MMMNARPATVPFVKPVETRTIRQLITSNRELVLTLTGPGAMSCGAEITVRRTHAEASENVSAQ